MNSKEIDLYEHNDPKLIYISENIPTPGTTDAFDEQFCNGCDCTDLCKIEYNCKCLLRSSAIYTSKSGLRNLHNYVISIDSTNRPIYECNSSCKCEQLCGNRLVQFGPRKKLEVRACKLNKGKTKGLGLTTTEDVQNGNFVCEYAGEVITKDEALRRHSFNKNHHLMNYIMCVNEEFGDRCISTYIDPSTLGNIGRYINHSCEPNCDLFIIRINNMIPKVCIFAKEDVSAGCELTFNYGNDDSSINNIVQDHVPCLCESKYCHGYMPFHMYL